MKFPDYPQEGTPIEDTIVQMLNWMRANNVVGIEGGSVQEGPNGKVIKQRKKPTVRNAGSSPNPFDVTLKGSGTEESPIYKVTVADGWVNERIPGVNDPATNATAVHKPHNILWGGDAVAPDVATDRRTFTITVGQQVSIVVNVDAEGAINLPSGSTEAGPTKIAIEAEDFKSIHYVPPRTIDGDAGSPGEYHYKLAVLRAADATHLSPWLEIFLAGSHIDHWQDLPVLDNCGAAATNVGRPFFKYRKDTDTYLFRPLNVNEGGQMELTENDSDDSGELSLRGNSQNLTLSITVEGPPESPGSPVEVLKTVDGFVTEVTDLTIPYPDIPEGAGMPVGYVGDMLYHNGIGWVLLSNPGAPVSGTENVMHHNGTAPWWDYYEKKTVNICVAGVPTAYTILAKPVV